MNVLVCHITNFYTRSLLKWEKKFAHINFLLINGSSMQTLTYKIKKTNITVFNLIFILKDVLLSKTKKKNKDFLVAKKGFNLGPKLM